MTESKIYRERESEQESEKARDEAGESPLIHEDLRLLVASPPRPKSWKATACWATSGCPGYTILSLSNQPEVVRRPTP